MAVSLQAVVADGSGVDELRVACLCFCSFFCSFVHPLSVRFPMGAGLQPPFVELLPGQEKGAGIADKFKDAGVVKSNGQKGVESRRHDGKQKAKRFGLGRRFLISVEGILASSL